MTLHKFLKHFKFLKLVVAFLIGAIIGAGILLVLSIATIIQVKKQYLNRVYPGVFLYSTSVSGKTQEEFDDFLSQRENKINNGKIIFVHKNNGERHWEIIPQMIDFSLDRESMARRAFSKGRTSTGGENLLEIYRLLLFPETIEPAITYNSGKLQSIIDQMVLEIDRPMQNALFEFKNNKVTSFQQSKEGRAVNRDEVESLILLAFSQETLNKEAIALDLPVINILPQTTTGSSNDLGIKELLGEGESFYKDSISSRIHNVILATSYLHGVVIPPGETFSFSEKIGTISAETGYQPAYVIKQGKTILDDGGGVCQVSTTVFRAALNAGLPITERHAHYYRVAYYEQGGYLPGLDATVYPPSPDLKFKNDTPAYVLIQTEIDKEKQRVVFRFYGTADGRKVEMKKPVIHSQALPPDPIYVDDPTLPVGVLKKVDSAHSGAKVSFTRKVMAADGKILEDKEYWSSYTPWPAVYQRGTKQ